MMPIANCNYETETCTNVWCALSLSHLKCYHFWSDAGKSHYWKWNFRWTVFNCVKHPCRYEQNILWKVIVWHSFHLVWHLCCYSKCKLTSNLHCVFNRMCGMCCCLRIFFFWNCICIDTKYYFISPKRIFAPFVFWFLDRELSYRKWVLTFGLVTQPSL